MTIPPPSPLRIVAAALKRGNMIFTGAHHHLILWQVACCMQEKPYGEQGFLASDGKWYNREDAHVIAEAAGQIRFPLPYASKHLFSEQLWCYADWLKAHKMGDSPEAVPEWMGDIPQWALNARNEMSKMLTEPADLNMKPADVDDAVMRIFLRHAPAVPARNYDGDDGTDIPAVPPERGAPFDEESTKGKLT